MFYIFFYNSKVLEICGKEISAFDFQTMDMSYIENDHTNGIFKSITSVFNYTI